jgi:hypothetical protein
MASVPGGATGLLVRRVKRIGTGPSAGAVEEFAVDTRILRELRAHEQQAARELGQWIGRSDVASMPEERPPTMIWREAIEGGEAGDSVEEQRENTERREAPRSRSAMQSPLHDGDSLGDDEAVSVGTGATVEGRRAGRPMTAVPLPTCDSRPSKPWKPTRTTRASRVLRVSSDLGIMRASGAASDECMHRGPARPSGAGENPERDVVKNGATMR